MNNMKQIFVLICIVKISQTAAELCSEYSVVLKYTESIPGQLFWKPLLPEDQNSPELKALFEKEKNCVLEVDCEVPTNLTDIILFTKEITVNDVQNDKDSDSSVPEICHIGSTSAACKKSDKEKYTYIDCDQVVNISNTKSIKIKVIPDDECKDDCFDIIWPNECTDKKSCKGGVKDKIISDTTTAITSSGEEVTDSTEVDNTTEKVGSGVNKGAVGSEEPKEKDLTALIVVAAIVGTAAICALLFFGVKTVAAYFKSKSYNVRDVEENANQNREERAKYN